MAIELFWGSGSGFSWRVQLVLEAKQIPYESHLLSFAAGEQQTPAYLAINPRGKVPALRDDGTVVTESIAIMAYLERRFPDPPLFGRTPAETGAIWQSVMETANYLDAPTEAFILPIYFGRLPEKAEEVKAAMPVLHDELARMNTRLAARPFLASDAPSAADFAAYPMVKSVLRAAGKPSAASLAADLRDLAPRYPAVARWMLALESLPYYERTYPPHWRG